MAWLEKLKTLWDKAVAAGKVVGTLNAAHIAWTWKDAAIFAAQWVFWSMISTGLNIGNTFGWGIYPVIGLGLAFVTSVSYYLFVSAKSLALRLGSKSDGYIETKLRLRKSQSTELYFEDAGGSTNIYSWQQVIARVDSQPEGKALLQNDTIAIIFDQPIKYGRPFINSYGQKFPFHNFWGTSDRGAVLQVVGEIDAREFEITFPPVQERKK